MMPGRSCGEMDVQRYLRRLNLENRREADLEWLQLLHERHLQTVPFENLDIHQGVEILLDEERILGKLVDRRRGGFCYELNGAFAWLLRQLGFRVSVLSAEVAREEGGFGIPFDHMTLRVDLDRPYLADVGFGDGFRCPLPLVSAGEVAQAGYVYHLRQDENWWVLERRPANQDSFQPQYRFTLEPRALEDFGPGCRYHQTSPDSTFTQQTVCSLALADGRLTLLPDRLVRTRQYSKTEEPLSDRAAWEEALRTHFGITL